MLLGGNIGFSKQDTKPDGTAANTTSFNVTPSFGIATKDNLLVGFSPAYGHNKSGFQNLAYAQYGHTRTTVPGGTEDVRENDFRLGAGLSSSLGRFVVGFKWLLN